LENSNLDKGLIANQAKALLLAAGLGTRLRPLTDVWPKCLMPIQKRPLLEYWLGIVKRVGIDSALVNLHYHFDVVKEFLDQSQFSSWVGGVYEDTLLGTAGTLRKNADYFKDSTVMLVHADNWCCCDFSDFVSYHHERRPAGTVITMMTFNCEVPQSCGIVELNQDGIVIGFHEKVENPPGSLANAAVYLIEPEVLEWIIDNPDVSDFSADVIPNYIGKIATWENTHLHTDIGTIEMLSKVQSEQCVLPPWTDQSKWQDNFSDHAIHKLIQEYIKQTTNESSK